MPTHPLPALEKHIVLRIAQLTVQIRILTAGLEADIERTKLLLDRLPIPPAQDSP